MIPFAWFARLAVATALAAALALSAAPQQPTFRAGIEVVQLDVSVLDQQGQPVRGLRPQDFVVLEDGKPQSIAAFKAIDLPDTVTSSTSTTPPAWTNTIARDVSTNQIDRHRLFIIVMDDATIVPDGSVIERAKDAARSVIDKMGPNDLATVMFTRRDNVNVQDFTNDHARLLDTVDTFSVGYMALPEPGGPARGRGSAPAATADCSSERDAIGVLKHVADYLAAAPDQRKTLVYVSSSLEVDFAKPDACGVSALARDAFRAAQLANVNIYPIDACGLRTSVPPGPNPPPCLEPMPGPPLFPNPNLHADFLRTIADNTGGQAIVMTNDFEPGIVQMFRQSSSYYLLGYTPSNVKADGTFRRIDVEVPSRRGVDVRTRKNYYAPDAKADAKNASVPPLTQAEKTVTEILPVTGVSLQMTAASFKHGDKAAVAVVLGVTRDAANAVPSDALDVVVSAFTLEGKFVAASEQTTRVAGVVPADGMLRYEALSAIALAPGRYELRAGVHSSALAKDGSVYGDLDVPDFSKTPLSLSGVMLMAVPGLLSEPKGGLAGVIPIVPTSQRTFDRGTHVSAFLRLYQGGRTPLAPVTVHASIRDEHDVAIVDRTDTVAASGFGASGRSADHYYDLPIAGLAPGEYVLTFEADKGRDTDWRNVRFTVK